MNVLANPKTNTNTVLSGSRPCAFVECIGLPAQPKHTQTSETLAPNAKDNFRYNSDPLLPSGAFVSCRTVQCPTWLTTDSNTRLPRTRMAE